MTLQCHGHEARRRKQRDEDERGVVAQGEAQNGDDRGDERACKCSLPDRPIREIQAEELAEAVIEGHRLQVHAQEGEKPGGGAGDRPGGGGTRREVERRVVLRLRTVEGEAHEHERAERARRTQVEEQLRDREAEPHDFARVDERGRIRTAAEGKSRKK